SELYEFALNPREAVETSWSHHPIQPSDPATAEATSAPRGGVDHNVFSIYSHVGRRPILTARKETRAGKATTTACAEHDPFSFSELIGARRRDADSEAGNCRCGDDGQRNRRPRGVGGDPGGAAGHSRQGRRSEWPGPG